MTFPDVIGVIPAYNPDGALVRLVEALRGALPLIVVNDGSHAAQQFERLPADVTVLTHATNRGKGAALRTAFRHVLAHHAHVVGVVTVDADGQHLPDDALKVARRLRECPSSLIFGVRRFTGDVPLRNRLGNVVTRFAVRAFLNIRLSDTQTGLRGLPREFLPAALGTPYDRYEFEAEMLRTAKGLGMDFEEVPIQTLYLADAETRSHFSPVVDSMRIYWTLFRHALAGLAAAVVDFGVYLVALFLSGHILASVCVGRASSLLVNFKLLRQFVFRPGGTQWRQLLLYLLHVAVMAVVTAQLIDLGQEALDIHPAASKVPIDLLVYPLNFVVQRRFIFRSSRRAESSGRA